MNITVNGKEYILEYTFEAAECHECIDAAMDIFGGMMTAKIDSKHSEEMQVRDFLMSLSDLPRMAMDMFYAGLLENHGTGPDGDGTITSRADARCLYKQFCKENPEDERATSYYALCNPIDHVDIKVVVTLDVDGREFELSKTQKQNWVKKRGTLEATLQGNDNLYEIDGVPKKEKDFKTFVSDIINEDLFQLLTNPQAFVSKKWKEQREELMKMIPGVDNDTGAGQ